MPVAVLTSDPKSLGRFFVIGQQSSSTDAFVRHVALHNADAGVRHGEPVDVVHMGPPLQQPGRMNAHIAGYVPLTTDEVSEIQTWIEKIADEYNESGAKSRDQYVIHPPSEDVRDLNTGVCRYRRFSCAGFVLDAHHQVDIELLRTNDDALPEVSESTLLSAYPELARMNPERREKLGLRSNGPWRIVLAGYVINSLDRSSGEIRKDPYQARASDCLY